MNWNRENFLDWVEKRGISREQAARDLDYYIKGGDSTRTLRIRTFLETYELMNGSDEYTRGWEDGYDYGYDDGVSE